MKYLRGSGLAAWALGLMAAITDCNGHDVSQVTGSIEGSADAGLPVGAPERCVPGQTFACQGACGMPIGGYQVCAADGRSYGPCSCPPVRVLSPLPVGTSTDDGARVLAPRLGSGALTGPRGSALTPGVGGAAAGDGVVGAACQRAADCLRGLSCTTSASTALAGQGPAGGYCSKSCMSPDDCSSIDANSACASIGGQSMCVRLCQSQGPAAGNDKCLARPDLTCVSVAALGQADPSDQPQLGICAPACQSDAGCGSRHCDPATGFCTDGASPGDPIGSDCSTPDSCAGGICLDLSDQTERFCSAFCTLGAPGCGFDGSEGTTGAACLLPQIPGETSGDRGLCFELCDRDSDCREPGSVCVPQPAQGRAGVCLRPTLPVGPVTPPPPVTTLPGTGAGGSASAPDGSSGSSSSPGGSTGSSSPIAVDAGAPCSADSDCGDGAQCLLSSGDPFLAGGGPAGGYCTVQCQVDADCAAADALCVATRGGLFCFKSCDLEGDAACGRDTLVCADLGGTTPRGFCRPECSADADCGERVCNLTSGLCVDASPCTSDADCAPRVCDLDSAECVAPPGCTSAADCDGGACDTSTGVCAPSACTSDADCAGQTCDVNSGSCLTPAAGCSSDTECPGQVCDADLGLCVAPDVCALDADCAAGVCDPTAGLCIDKPAIPIGGVCAADADCAGAFCLDSGTVSFCSGACLLGTASGCEAYGTDAFCLLPVPNRDPLGVCLELCNTPADCAQTGFDCIDIGGTLSGYTGGCLPSTPPG